LSDSIADIKLNLDCLLVVIEYLRAHKYRYLLNF
jgi:hypothetical protein